MAVNYANLYNISGSPPGRAQYRYDTTDDPDTVEAANYFNNSTGHQVLAVGDTIKCVMWSATAFAVGSTITKVKDFIVTNVIANNAAANAGAVNVAEMGISSAGVLSSLA